MIGYETLFDHAYWFSAGDKGISYIGVLEEIYSLLPAKKKQVIKFGIVGLVPA